jgi:hypothetical protein
MKNNYKKIIILIGILLTITVVFVFSLKNFSFQKEKEILPEQKQEIIQEKVSLVINYGDEELNKNIQVDFKEGMTAFGLLKDEAEKLKLSLKTKNYDVGIFIESIGDTENGKEGKYWMYYVNGEMPMVSSDKKELKNGDKVEFKFEKSEF